VWFRKPWGCPCRVLRGEPGIDLLAERDGLPEVGLTGRDGDFTVHGRGQERVVACSISRWDCRPHPSRSGCTVRIGTPAASFSEAPVRAVCAAGGPRAVSRSPDSSHGVHRSPLRRPMPLRPLPDEPELALRPGVATPRARSVLAVPPGSDGFLRSRVIPREIPPLAFRGFVAPRNRPWGSPRFRAPGRDPKIAPAPFLDGATPSEAFPSPTAGRSSPRSPAFTDRSCPPAVSTTSGLCSAGESVVAARRCRPAPPDAPMGFCTDVCCPAIPPPGPKPVRLGHRGCVAS
jgi:hypothetical protein